MLHRHPEPYKYPKIHILFQNLKNFDFTKSAEIPYNDYNEMPSISIDYSIMEKSDKIALVELKSDWNDLGSWKSIYDVSKKDEFNLQKQMRYHLEFHQIFGG